MRTPTAKLIEQVVPSLRKELGEKYQVVPQYLSASIEGVSIKSQPDVIIFNNETQKLTIVEIKGSKPDEDLPFATLPIIRRIKEANKSVNPNVILVSTSNVPAALADELKNEGIDVIEWSEDKNIIPTIIDVIKKSALLQFPTVKSRM